MKKQKQKDMRKEEKEKEDIVAFLMENVYKQNKIDFYTNLEVSKLEDLISSVFSDRQMTREQNIFVVSLLKKNTFILSVAFGNTEFNFKEVFAFITRNKLTMDKLNALEQILMPFCKKFPDKVLGLLKKNLQIKGALFQHIYIKSIFKMLYTIVFCIDEHQIEENQKIMADILEIMVFSLFQYNPDTFPQSKPFQFLDITNIPGNYKDFLSDLALNLSGVQLDIFLSQVKCLNNQFIKKLMQLFEKYKDQEDLSEYCENIILILVNIGKIFQSLKINLNKKTSQKLYPEIEKTLLTTCKQIASNIPTFTDFLLTKSKKTLPSSSGQIITVVGMVRYRILVLVQKLFSINEIEDLEIDFEKFDFLPVVELYIQRHKWNNIVHNIVLKITELLISRDYKHFKERHILTTQSYSQGFFGNLIANFRNRKFIFLHSMRMMNQGNRHSVYELSKLLVNQMSERNDLSFLIQNFKVWKQFMERDMKDFQTGNQDYSKLPNCVEFVQKTRTRNNSFEFASGSQLVGSGSHYGKSLQTFQQVMLKLREQEKWSPKLKMEQEDKCKLIEMQNLDSLSSFALNKR